MIVAVCGGKGGVGKSTVTLNLGRELDAVIVDADLTTPNLPWGRGPDLHDVMADRASPVEAVEEIGSVQILPCGRSLAGARAADLSKLAEIVSMLDRQYGRVLLDCPAGLADDVGYQLFSSDASVVVTRPNRAAIASATRTRDLSHKVDTPVVGAVVNMLSGSDDEEDDEEEAVPPVVDRMEKEFGAPTTGLQRRPEIRRAQEKWLPLREHDADSPGLEAFEDLAETIEKSERQLDANPGALDS